MAKAPTGKQLAEALCRKFPKAPSKQLGRILYDENKERFASFNSAYCTIRRVRGALGNPSDRNPTATVPREHGKSGWKPECPPSLAEDWTPHQIDGPAVVVSLSDTHLPYHDRRAIEVAVKHAKKRHKPNHLFINGDYADFYNLSRWEKDPKKRDFKGEIETAREGLGWLRKQFPKAEFTYKLGNHDERWDHYIWNKAPELCELECVQLHNVFEFEKHGITRVGEKRPVLLGRLPALHGHEFNRGFTSPVNPARGAFLRTYHTVLVAHNHTSSNHSQTPLFGNEIVCWSQGHLADPHPPYMPINNWSWGFPVIEIDKDGGFNVFNYRISKSYEVWMA